MNMAYIGQVQINVFFYMYGYAMLIFGIRSIILGYRSRNWRMVDAEVVSRNKYTIMYSVEDVQTNYDFSYAYKVENTDYVSARYNFGFNQIMGTEKKEKRYKEGTIIKVYYNPKKPGNSTVHKGVQLWEVICAIVGVAWLIIFTPK